MVSHFLESRASASVLLAWEDKHHNHECLPLIILSLSFYFRAWCHTSWNIPLVSGCQLCWLCTFPVSCALPAYSLWGVQSGKEKALVLCTDCSATAKMLLSTLFQQQIQNTAPYGLLWRKLTPSQPELVNYQLGSVAVSSVTWTGIKVCVVTSAEHSDRCRGRSVWEQWKDNELSARGSKNSGKIKVTGSWKPFQWKLCVLTSCWYLFEGFSP